MKIKKTKLLKIWEKFTDVRYFFLLGFFVFTLLLLRDPFGQRTLIPNLEPFPDTFHYVVPARSLLQGKGFMIAREFGSLKPVAAPLYSLTLVPFYMINLDPRVYYFANMFLSLISYVIFFRILKKLTNNKWITGFALLLYATNYYFYWYPTWAMSENLILPLFLSAVLLLLSDFSSKNLILAGLIAAGLYGTKYANALLTATFMGLYALKIFNKQEGKWCKKVRTLAVFLLSFVTLMVPISWYALCFQDGSQLKTILPLIKALLSAFSKPQAGSVSAGATQATSWFSVTYIGRNLPRYLNSIKGGSERFLWEFTPILPKWVAMTGLLGLFSGLLTKKYRFLSFALVLLISIQILFISCFYAFDTRYTYQAIPTLLLGFVFFLIIVFTTVQKKKLKSFFYIFWLGLVSLYLLTNAIRVGKQIVLNLKYAEVPWLYISVLRLNDYFSYRTVTKDPKPVVISPLPPYFFDYYSNGNYDLLPLSLDQEFRAEREKIWGPGDYSDLHKLYKTYLDSGRDLYMATYGLGVEGYLHNAFRELNEGFKLTEVYNGCYDLCKIYKVE